MQVPHFSLLTFLESLNVYQKEAEKDEVSATVNVFTQSLTAFVTIAE